MTKSQIMEMVRNSQKRRSSHSAALFLNKIGGINMEVTLEVKTNIDAFQELLKQVTIQSEQLQETLKKIEEFNLEVEVQS